MDSFRKMWFGSVTVDDRQITITGLASQKTIPLDRVTSVSGNRVMNWLDIETGAQKHRVSLWGSGNIARLQDAIESRLR